MIRIATALALTQFSVSGAIIFEVPTEPIRFFARPRIDMDGNGSIDFRFGGLPGTSATVVTERSNRYLGIPAPPPRIGGRPFPLADNTMIGGIETPIRLMFLSSDPSDDFVDPDQTTGTTSNLYLCLSNGCSGLFLGEPGSTSLRGLLGVQFESDNGTHFGYFDIETISFGRQTMLHGWAYESEPNTPINARFIPEPSTLLLSIFGLAAIMKRRR